MFTRERERNDGKEKKRKRDGRKGEARKRDGGKGTGIGYEGKVTE
jgi:hypothetical protein